MHGMLRAVARRLLLIMTTLAFVVATVPVLPVASVAAAPMVAGSTHDCDGMGKACDPMSPTDPAKLPCGNMVACVGAVALAPAVVLERPAPRATRSLPAAAQPLSGRGSAPDPFPPKSSALA
jgi:hypothetical protein